jgi:hypothetical protein
MDDDEELDIELAKAPGDSEKGYAKAIAETWNELEAKAESRAELEEIFAPHMEALAEQGHTPASWVRTAIGSARELEARIATNPEAYAEYQQIVQGQRFEGEWSRFRKAHPDA